MFSAFVGAGLASIVALAGALWAARWLSGRTAAWRARVQRSRRERLEPTISALSRMFVDHRRGTPFRVRAEETHPLLPAAVQLIRSGADSTAAKVSLEMETENALSQARLERFAVLAGTLAFPVLVVGSLVPWVRESGLVHGTLAMGFIGAGLVSYAAASAITCTWILRLRKPFEEDLKLEADLLIYACGLFHAATRAEEFTDGLRHFATQATGEGLKMPSEAEQPAYPLRMVA